MERQGQRCRAGREDCRSAISEDEESGAACVGVDCQGCKSVDGVRNLDEGGCSVESVPLLSGFINGSNVIGRDPALCLKAT